MFYIGDVSIPHSWHVIEKDINDILYIQIISNNSLIDNVCSIKIGPGNYNGNDLANELTRKSNIVINDIPNASFSQLLIHRKQILFFLIINIAIINLRF